MRGIVLLGIALCSSAIGAAVLSMAMSRPAHQPKQPKTSEARDEAQSPAVTDVEIGPPSRVDPSPAAPAEGAEVSGMTSDENRQELSNGLEGALRARQAINAPGRSAQSARRGTATVEGQTGTEVEGLAQQLAPALAREALSAQKTPRMAEVETELVETWKEQKQILAGQRDTVDSVMHAQ